MITQYFDINQRLIIQAPGTLAPASLQPWVYADNYNLAIYLVSQGNVQPIGSTDSLSLMLFQPVQTLPEQNLAIISVPVIKTDVAGQNYYQVNVNLGTVPLANLVQTPNAPAKCEFHYIFNPATGERFSSSADIPVTVNPDPTKDATGATPIPPSYPTNPNLFELIGHKGAVNGYAGLDSTGKVPVAQLPASTAGGDMLKSVYDTDGNGLVDTCDTLQVSRVVGLGSAATQNVPASGNASANQVVLGNDTRLSNARAPTPHESTHLTGGSDSIPVASPSGQGLCPQLDGITLQIDGNGHLVATTTGSGDMLKSVYATNNPLNTTGIVDNALSVQTHQIPATGNASGAQLVLATDTRLSDARTPLAHQSTHMPAGSDALPLATPTTPGLCPAVDNVTIQISSSKLAAILATSIAPGIVRPDNTTINISGGVLSAVGLGAHGVKTHNSGSIVLSTASQILTFDTNDFDTDTYHSTTTNPSRITIPAGQPGYYAVGAHVVFTASSSGTYRRVGIKINSTTNLYAVVQTINNNNGDANCACSTVRKFIAGDWIECEVIQDGTTLSAIAFGGCAPGMYAFRIG